MAAPRESRSRIVLLFAVAMFVLPSVLPMSAFAQAAPEGTSSDISPEERAAFLDGYLDVYVDGTRALADMPTDYSALAPETKLSLAQELIARWKATSPGDFSLAAAVDLGLARESDPLVSLDGVPLTPERIEHAILQRVGSQIFDRDVYGLRLSMAPWEREAFVDGYLDVFVRKTVRLPDTPGHHDDLSPQLAMALAASIVERLKIWNETTAREFEPAIAGPRLGMSQPGNPLVDSAGEPITRERVESVMTALVYNVVFDRVAFFERLAGMFDGMRDTLAPGSGNPADVGESTELPETSTGNASALDMVQQVFYERPLLTWGSEPAVSIQQTGDSPESHTFDLPNGGGGTVKFSGPSGFWNWSAEPTEPVLEADAPTSSSRAATPLLATVPLPPADPTAPAPTPLSPSLEAALLAALEPTLSASGTAGAVLVAGAADAADPLGSLGLVVPDAREPVTLQSGAVASPAAAPLAGLAASLGAARAAAAPIPTPTKIPMATAEEPPTRAPDRAVYTGSVNGRAFTGAWGVPSTVVTTEGPEELVIEYVVELSLASRSMSLSEGVVRTVPVLTLLRQPQGNPLEPLPGLDFDVRFAPPEGTTPDPPVYVDLEGSLVSARDSIEIVVETLDPAIAVTLDAAGAGSAFEARAWRDVAGEWAPVGVRVEGAATPASFSAAASAQPAARTATAKLRTLSAAPVEATCARADWGDACGVAVTAFGIQTTAGIIVERVASPLWTASVDASVSDGTFQVTATAGSSLDLSWQTGPADLSTYVHRAATLGRSAATMSGAIALDSARLDASGTGSEATLLRVDVAGEAATETALVEVLGAGRTVVATMSDEAFTLDGGRTARSVRVVRADGAGVLPPTSPGLLLVAPGLVAFGLAGVEDASTRAEGATGTAIDLRGNGLAGLAVDSTHGGDRVLLSFSNVLTTTTVRAVRDSLRIGGIGLAGAVVAETAFAEADGATLRSALSLDDLSGTFVVATGGSTVTSVVNGALSGGFFAATNATVAGAPAYRWLDGRHALAHEEAGARFYSAGLGGGAGRILGAVSGAFSNLTIESSDPAGFCQSFRGGGFVAELCLSNVPERIQLNATIAPRPQLRYEATHVIHLLDATIVGGGVEIGILLEEIPKVIDLGLTTDGLALATDTRFGGLNFTGRIALPAGGGELVLVLDLEDVPTQLGLAWDDGTLEQTLPPGDAVGRIYAEIGLPAFGFVVELGLLPSFNLAWTDSTFSFRPASGTRLGRVSARAVANGIVLAVNGVDIPGVEAAWSSAGGSLATLDTLGSFDVSLTAGTSFAFTFGLQGMPATDVAWTASSFSVTPTTGRIDDLRLAFLAQGLYGALHAQGIPGFSAGWTETGGAVTTTGTLDALHLSLADRIVPIPAGSVTSATSEAALADGSSIALAGDLTFAAAEAFLTRGSLLSSDLAVFVGRDVVLQDDTPLTNVVLVVPGGRDAILLANGSAPASGPIDLGNATLPAGVLVMLPSGDLVAPDGSALPRAPVSLRGGGIVVADGAVRLPGAAFLFPSGLGTLPNGTVLVANGAAALTRAEVPALEPRLLRGAGLTAAFDLQGIPAIDLAWDPASFTIDASGAALALVSARLRADDLFLNATGVALPGLAAAWDGPTGSLRTLGPLGSLGVLLTKGRTDFETTDAASFLDLLSSQAAFLQIAGAPAFEVSWTPNGFELAPDLPGARIDRVEAVVVAQGVAVTMALEEIPGVAVAWSPAGGSLATDGPLGALRANLIQGPTRFVQLNLSELPRLAASWADGALDVETFGERLAALDLVVRDGAFDLQLLAAGVPGFSAAWSASGGSWTTDAPLDLLSLSVETPNAAALVELAGVPELTASWSADAFSVAPVEGAIESLTIEIETSALAFAVAGRGIPGFGVAWTGAGGTLATTGDLRSLDLSVEETGGNLAHVNVTDVPRLAASWTGDAFSLLPWAGRLGNVTIDLVTGDLRLLVAAAGVPGFELATTDSSGVLTTTDRLDALKIYLADGAVSNVTLEVTGVPALSASWSDGRMTLDFAGGAIESVLLHMMTPQLSLTLDAEGVPGFVASWADEATDLSTFGTLDSLTLDAATADTTLHLALAGVPALTASLRASSFSLVPSAGRIESAELALTTPLMTASLDAAGIPGLTASWSAGGGWLNTTATLDRLDLAVVRGSALHAEVELLDVPPLAARWSAGAFAATLASGAIGSLRLDFDVADFSLQALGTGIPSVAAAWSASGGSLATGGNLTSLDIALTKGTSIAASFEVAGAPAFVSTWTAAAVTLNLGTLTIDSIGAAVTLPGFTFSLDATEIPGFTAAWTGTGGDLATAAPLGSLALTLAKATEPSLEFEVTSVPALTARWRGDGFALDLGGATIDSLRIEYLSTTLALSLEAAGIPGLAATWGSAGGTITSAGALDLLDLAASKVGTFAATLVVDDLPAGRLTWSDGAFVLDLGTATVAQLDFTFAGGGLALAAHALDVPGFSAAWTANAGSLSSQGPLGLLDVAGSKGTNLALDLRLEDVPRFTATWAPGALSLLPDAPIPRIEAMLRVDDLLLTLDAVDVPGFVASWSATAGRFETTGALSRLAASVAKGAALSASVLLVNVSAFEAEWSPNAFSIAPTGTGAPATLAERVLARAVAGDLSLYVDAHGLPGLSVGWTASGGSLTTAGPLTSLAAEVRKGAALSANVTLAGVAPLVATWSDSAFSILGSGLSPPTTLVARATANVLAGGLTLTLDAQGIPGIEAAWDEDGGSFETHGPLTSLAIGVTSGATVAADVLIEDVAPLTLTWAAGAISIVAADNPAPATLIGLVDASLVVEDLALTLVAESVPGLSASWTATGGALTTAGDLVSLAIELSKGPALAPLVAASLLVAGVPPLTVSWSPGAFGFDPGLQTVDAIALDVLSGDLHATFAATDVPRFAVTWNDGAGGMAAEAGRVETWGPIGSLSASLTKGAGLSASLALTDVPALLARVGPGFFSIQPTPANAQIGGIEAAFLAGDLAVTLEAQEIPGMTASWNSGAGGGNAGSFATTGELGLFDMSLVRGAAVAASARIVDAPPMTLTWDTGEFSLITPVDPQTGGLRTIGEIAADVRVDDLTFSLDALSVPSLVAQWTDFGATVTAGTPGLNDGFERLSVSLCKGALTCAASAIDVSFLLEDADRSGFSIAWETWDGIVPGFVNRTRLVGGPLDRVLAEGRIDDLEFALDVHSLPSFLAFWTDERGSLDVNGTIGSLAARVAKGSAFEVLLELETGGGLTATWDRSDGEAHLASDSPATVAIERILLDATVGGFSVYVEGLGIPELDVEWLLTSDGQEGAHFLAARGIQEVHVAATSGANHVAFDLEDAPYLEFDLWTDQNSTSTYVLRLYHPSERGVPGSFPAYAIGHVRAEVTTNSGVTALMDAVDVPAFRFTRTHDGTTGRLSTQGALTSLTILAATPTLDLEVVALGVPASNLWVNATDFVYVPSGGATIQSVRFRAKTPTLKVWANLTQVPGFRAAFSPSLSTFDTSATLGGLDGHIITTSYDVRFGVTNAPALSAQIETQRITVDLAGRIEHVEFAVDVPADSNHLEFEADQFPGFIAEWGATHSLETEDGLDHLEVRAQLGANHFNFALDGLPPTRLALLEAEFFIEFLTPGNVGTTRTVVPTAQITSITTDVKWDDVRFFLNATQIPGVHVTWGPSGGTFATATTLGHLDLHFLRPNADVLLVVDNVAPLFASWTAGTNGAGHVEVCPAGTGGASCGAGVLIQNALVDVKVDDIRFRLEGSNIPGAVADWNGTAGFFRTTATLTSLDILLKKGTTAEATFSLANAPILRGDWLTGGGAVKSKFTLATTPVGQQIGSLDFAVRAADLVLEVGATSFPGIHAEWNDQGGNVTTAAQLGSLSLGLEKPSSGIDASFSLVGVPPVSARWADGIFELVPTSGVIQSADFDVTVGDLHFTLEADGIPGIVARWGANGGTVNTTAALEYLSTTFEKSTPGSPGYRFASMTLAGVPRFNATWTPNSMTLDLHPSILSTPGGPVLIVKIQTLTIDIVADDLELHLAATGVPDLAATWSDQAGSFQTNLDLTSLEIHVIKGSDIDALVSVQNAPPLTATWNAAATPAEMSHLHVLPDVGTIGSVLLNATIGDLQAFFDAKNVPGVTADWNAAGGVVEMTGPLLQLTARLRKGTLFGEIVVFDVPPLSISWTPNSLSIVPTGVNSQGEAVIESIDIVVLVDGLAFELHGVEVPGIVAQWTDQTGSVATTGPLSSLEARIVRGVRGDADFISARFLAEDIAKLGASWSLGVPGVRNCVLIEPLGPAQNTAADCTTKTTTNPGAIIERILVDLEVADPAGNLTFFFDAHDIPALLAKWDETGGSFTTGAALTSLEARLAKGTDIAASLLALDLPPLSVAWSPGALSITPTGNNNAGQPVLGYLTTDVRAGRLSFNLTAINVPGVAAAWTGRTGTVYTTSSLQFLSARIRQGVAGDADYISAYMEAQQIAKLGASWSVGVPGVQNCILLEPLTTETSANNCTTKTSANSGTAINRILVDLKVADPTGDLSMYFDAQTIPGLLAKWNATGGSFATSAPLNSLTARLAKGTTLSAFVQALNLPRLAVTWSTAAISIVPTGNNPLGVAKIGSLVVGVVANRLSFNLTALGVPGVAAAWNAQTGSVYTTGSLDLLTARVKQGVPGDADYILANFTAEGVAKLGASWSVGIPGVRNCVLIEPLTTETSAASCVGKTSANSGTLINRIYVDLQIADPTGDLVFFFDARQIPGLLAKWDTAGGSVRTNAVLDSLVARLAKGTALYAEFTLDDLPPVNVVWTTSSLSVDPDPGQTVKRKLVAATLDVRANDLTFFLGAYGVPGLYATWGPGGGNLQFNDTLDELTMKLTKGNQLLPETSRDIYALLEVEDLPPLTASWTTSGDAGSFLLSPPPDQVIGSLLVDVRLRNLDLGSTHVNLVKFALDAQGVPGVSASWTRNGGTISTLEDLDSLDVEVIADLVVAGVPKYARGIFGLADLPPTDVTWTQSSLDIEFDPAQSARGLTRLGSIYADVVVQDVTFFLDAAGVPGVHAEWNATGGILAFNDTLDRLTMKLTKGNLLLPEGDRDIYAFLDVVNIPQLTATWSTDADEGAFEIAPDGVIGSLTVDVRLRNLNIGNIHVNLVKFALDAQGVPGANARWNNTGGVVNTLADLDSLSAEIVADLVVAGIPRLARGELGLVDLPPTQIEWTSNSVDLTFDSGASARGLTRLGEVFVDVLVDDLHFFLDAAGVPGVHAEWGGAGGNLVFDDTLDRLTLTVSKGNQLLPENRRDIYAFLEVVDIPQLTAEWQTGGEAGSFVLAPDGVIGSLTVDVRLRNVAVGNVYVNFVTFFLDAQGVPGVAANWTSDGGVVETLADLTSLQVIVEADVLISSVPKYAFAEIGLGDLPPTVVEWTPNSLDITYNTAASAAGLTRLGYVYVDVLVEDLSVFLDAAGVPGVHAEWGPGGGLLQFTDTLDRLTAEVAKGNLLLPKGNRDIYAFLQVTDIPALTATWDISADEGTFEIAPNGVIGGLVVDVRIRNVDLGAIDVNLVTFYLNATGIPGVGASWNRTGGAIQTLQDLTSISVIVVADIVVNGIGHYATAEFGLGDLPPTIVAWTPGSLDISFDSELSAAGLTRLGYVFVDVLVDDLTFFLEAEGVPGVHAEWGIGTGSIGLTDTLDALTMKLTKGTQLVETQRDVYVFFQLTQVPEFAASWNISSAGGTLGIVPVGTGTLVGGLTIDVRVDDITFLLAGNGLPGATATWTSAGTGSFSTTGGVGSIRATATKGFARSFDPASLTAIRALNPTNEGQFWVAVTIGQVPQITATWSPQAIVIATPAGTKADVLGIEAKGRLRLLGLLRTFYARLEATGVPSVTIPLPKPGDTSFGFEAPDGINSIILEARDIPSHPIRSVPTGASVYLKEATKDFSIQIALADFAGILVRPDAGGKSTTIDLKFTKDFSISLVAWAEVVSLIPGTTVKLDADLSLVNVPAKLSMKFTEDGLAIDGTPVNPSRGVTRLTGYLFAGTLPEYNLTPAPATAAGILANTFIKQVTTLGPRCAGEPAWQFTGSSYTITDESGRFSLSGGSVASDGCGIGQPAVNTFTGQGTSLSFDTDGPLVPGTTLGVLPSITLFSGRNDVKLTLAGVEATWRATSVTFVVPAGISTIRAGSSNDVLPAMPGKLTITVNGVSYTNQSAPGTVKDYPIVKIGFATKIRVDVPLPTDLFLTKADGTDGVPEGFTMTAGAPLGRLDLRVRFQSFTPTSGSQPELDLVTLLSVTNIPASVDVKFKTGDDRALPLEATEVENLHVKITMSEGIDEIFLGLRFDGCFYQGGGCSSLIPVWAKVFDIPSSVDLRLVRKTKLVDETVAGLGKRLVYLNGAGTQLTSQIDATNVLEGVRKVLQDCGAACRMVKIEDAGGAVVRRRVTDEASPPVLRYTSSSGSAGLGLGAAVFVDITTVAALPQLKGVKDRLGFLSDHDVKGHLLIMVDDLPGDVEVKIEGLGVVVDPKATIVPGHDELGLFYVDFQLYFEGGIPEVTAPLNLGIARIDFFYGMEWRFGIPTLKLALKDLHYVKVEIGMPTLRMQLHGELQFAFRAAVSIHVWAGARIYATLPFVDEIFLFCICIDTGWLSLVVDPGFISYEVIEKSCCSFNFWTTWFFVHGWHGCSCDWHEHVGVKYRYPGNWQFDLGLFIGPLCNPNDPILSLFCFRGLHRTSHSGIGTFGIMLNPRILACVGDIWEDERDSICIPVRNGLIAWLSPISADMGRLYPIEWNFFLAFATEFRVWVDFWRVHHHH